MFLDSYRHTDNPHLQRALDVALGGSRTSWPNPAVGCVIVRHGEGHSGEDLIVGEGFHARAGEPHAEVNALAQAGELASGATAYVTLEPCNHTGRTGPCSQALIEAGVSRVVIGMADPNPRAHGGADALRQSGVAAEFADDPSPFEYHLRGWRNRLSAGLPLVVAKVGASLDGSVALERGVRTAITGPSGRQVTNHLRRTAHAVMVSSMTVRADNPSLLATDDAGIPLRAQPLRVVLCQTQLPREGSAVLVDGQGPTALLVPAGTALEGEARTLADRSTASGGDVRALTYPADRSIRGALETLGALGIGELLVEPGPRLLTLLLRAGLVDELVTVTAGGFLGQESLHLWAGSPTLAPIPGEGLRVLAPTVVPVSAAVHGDVVVALWRSVVPSIDTGAVGADGSGT